MVFGLALVLALIFGVATVALAAVPGDPFKLGERNAISVITKLTGRVAGPNLQITNTSDDSAATALTLNVKDGKAPLKVANPNSGIATNLNADQIDGLDSTELRQRTGVYVVSKVHNGMANMTTFDAVGCDDGDEVLAGGYVGLSSGARVVASTSQSNGTEWVTGLESGSTAGSVNMIVECYDYPPAHS
jgi:hypothetical protein